MVKNRPKAGRGSTPVGRRKPSGEEESYSGPLDDGGSESDGPENVGSTQPNLDLDSLRKVFHLPCVEAATALGVAHSKLKRRCHKLKIARWPQRKLASLVFLRDALPNDSRLTEAQREYIRNKIDEEYGKVMMDPNHPLDKELEQLRKSNYKLNYNRKLKGAAPTARQAAPGSWEPPPTRSSGRNASGGVSLGGAGGGGSSNADVGSAARMGASGGGSGGQMRRLLPGLMLGPSGSGSGPDSAPADSPPWEAEDGAAGMQMPYLGGTFSGSGQQGHGMGPGPSMGLGVGGSLLNAAGEPLPPSAGVASPRGLLQKRLGSTHGPPGRRSSLERAALLSVIADGKVSKQASRRQSGSGSGSGTPRQGTPPVLAGLGGGDGVGGGGMGAGMGRPGSGPGSPRLRPGSSGGPPLSPRQGRGRPGAGGGAGGAGGGGMGLHPMHRDGGGMLDGWGNGPAGTGGGVGGMGPNLLQLHQQDGWGSAPLAADGRPHSPAGGPPHGSGPGAGPAQALGRQHLSTGMDPARWSTGQLHHTRSSSLVAGLGLEDRLGGGAPLAGGPGGGGGGGLGGPRVDGAAGMLGSLLTDMDPGAGLMGGMDVAANAVKSAPPGGMSLGMDRLSAEELALLGIQGNDRDLLLLEESALESSSALMDPLLESLLGPGAADNLALPTRTSAPLLGACRHAHSSQVHMQQQQQPLMQQGHGFGQGIGQGPHFAGGCRTSDAMDGGLAGGRGFGTGLQVQGGLGGLQHSPHHQLQLHQRQHRLSSMTGGQLPQRASRFASHEPIGAAVARNRQSSDGGLYGSGSGGGGGNGNMSYEDIMVPIGGGVGGGNRTAPGGAAGGYDGGIGGGMGGQMRQQQHQQLQALGDEPLGLNLGGADGGMGGGSSSGAGGGGGGGSLMSQRYAAFLQEEGRRSAPGHLTIPGWDEAQGHGGGMGGGRWGAGDDMGLGRHPRHQQPAHVSGPGSLEPVPETTLLGVNGPGRPRQQGMGGGVVTERTLPGAGGGGGGLGRAGYDSTPYSPHQPGAQYSPHHHNQQQQHRAGPGPGQDAMRLGAAGDGRGVGLGAMGQQIAGGLLSESGPNHQPGRSASSSMLMPQRGGSSAGLLAHSRSVGRSAAGLNGGGLEPALGSGLPSDWGRHQHQPALQPDDGSGGLPTGAQLFSRQEQQAAREQLARAMQRNTVQGQAMGAGGGGGGFAQGLGRSGSSGHGLQPGGGGYGDGSSGVQHHLMQGMSSGGHPQQPQRGAGALTSMQGLRLRGEGQGQQGGGHGVAAGGGGGGGGVAGPLRGISIDMAAILDELGYQQHQHHNHQQHQQHQQPLRDMAPPGGHRHTLDGPLDMARGNGGGGLGGLGGPPGAAAQHCGGGPGGSVLGGLDMPSSHLLDSLDAQIADIDNFVERNMDLLRRNSGAFGSFTEGGASFSLSGLGARDVEAMRENLKRELRQGSAEQFEDMFRHLAGRDVM